MRNLIHSPTSAWNAFLTGAFAVMAPVFGIFFAKAIFALGDLKDAALVAAIGLVCTAVGGVLGGLCFAVPVLLKNWLYRRIQDLPSDHEAMK